MMSTPETMPARLPWYRSVLIRIIFVLVAATGVAQASVYYLVMRQDYVTSLEAFRTSLDAFVKGRAQLLGPLVWRLQFEELDNAVKSIVSERHIVSAVVKDETGAILSRADEAPASAGQVVTSALIIYENNFVSSRAGVLEIVATLAPLHDAYMKRSSDMVILFVVSALIIVFVASLALNAGVGRPVWRLREAIWRSQNGEKGVRVSPRRPDEIGTLVQSFNSFMSAQEVAAATAERANIRLAHLAEMDELTGLRNRRAAVDRFKTLKTTRNVSVIFIDVDHFKSVNDLLGHSGGDRMLRSLASALKRSLDAENAVAYRIGGDEFLVIHEGLNTVAEASAAADRILEAVSGDHTAGFLNQSLSVSVGVYHSEGELGGFDEVISLASEALRAAKAAGRSRTVVLDKTLRDAAIDKLKLKRDLLLAIENKQFDVYFQTRVDARSGRTVGAEALSRWNRPGHGIVGPNEFMPLIYEAHSSLDHGKLVVAQACRAAVEFRRQLSKDFSVSNNENYQQLSQLSFWSHLMQELTRTGLPASAIELEITENTLIHNFERISHALQQFRAAGGMVSLDDFGTGYSSMVYLTKLPIDIIKIDRTFVSNATSDTVAAAVISATITLAKTIGVGVVAEGIETASEEALVISAGVDFLQGYRYSIPLPLHTILRASEREIEVMPRSVASAR